MFSYSRRTIENAGLQALRVMIFHPRGMYPGGTYRTEGGVFHADEQLAFLVTRGRDWRSLLAEPAYSEFDWAGPDEMRLMASILLCESTEGPPIRFYPDINLTTFVGLPTEFPFTSGDMLALRDQIITGASSEVPQHMRERLGRIAGFRYEPMDPKSYSMDRHLELWTAIDPSDVLLARGIGALIKSDMLGNYSEFGEEALISTYIALEVSFKLVCARLRSDGTLNPTAHDAALWMHEHFDKHFGHQMPDALDRYFAEFYDGRVMTMHPSSRFGDFPYAPAMHDDTMHLRTQLRHVFSFLTIGRLDDDFAEEARRYKERFGIQFT